MTGAPFFLKNGFGTDIGYWTYFSFYHHRQTPFKVKSQT